MRPCFSLCSPRQAARQNNPLRESLAFHEQQAAVLHPFFRNGRWGYIDNQGRIVIAPQFDWAKDFFEDRAAVAVRTPEQSGFIRPDGSWAVILAPGAFPSRRFTEGRAWFRHGKLFGCVDLEGNIVIPAKYDWFEEFSEGLAVVGIGRQNVESREGRQEDKERYGFVDRSGRRCAPAPVFKCQPVRRRIARMRRPGIGSYEYIDKTGNVVFSLAGLRPDPQCFVGYASEFTNGRAAVWFDGSLPALPFVVFIDDCAAG